MPKFTPPLGARGIYTLRTPFPNITTKIYQCSAIRSFRDYLDLGKSAYEEIYLPLAIDEADYLADLAAGANIVTLISPNNPTVYVPDTFITKYPDLEYVQYANIVVSAALGAVPDELDLSLMQEQVAGVISDVIGVTPIVRIHAYESGGVVTRAQHEINELARNAAVTNRVTDRARYLAIVEERAALQARLVDLEDALEALSPP